jgi:hypothetical protein
MCIFQSISNPTLDQSTCCCHFGWTTGMVDCSVVKCLVRHHPTPFSVVGLVTSLFDLTCFVTIDLKMWVSTLTFGIRIWAHHAFSHDIHKCAQKPCVHGGANTPPSCMHWMKEPIIYVSVKQMGQMWWNTILSPSELCYSFTVAQVTVKGSTRNVSLVLFSLRFN